MKNKMKTLLCLLLSLIMCGAMFVPAMAEEPPTLERIEITEEVNAINEDYIPVMPMQPNYISDEDPIAIGSAIAQISTTTPSPVTEAEALAEIEELKEFFVQNLHNVSLTPYNKFFTVNQQPCGYEPHAVSDETGNCLLSEIAEAEWFLDFMAQKYEGITSFNYELVPRQYNYLENQLSVDGYQCYGFANFAHWYIFSQESTDLVVAEFVAAGPADYSTLYYAKAGDVLRTGEIDGHSMVFVEHDPNGEGYWVLDCNAYFAPSNYPSCEVNYHYVKYDSSEQIAITGVVNYDREGNDGNISYTYSFNANGGTNAPESQTKPYGEGFTLPAAPVREGYDFIGWTEGLDGAALYSEGETVWFNRDITFYARWKSNNYEPTPTEGGSLRIETSSNLLNAGESISVILSLENNPGINNFCGELKFDSEVFELTSIYYADGFSGEIPVLLNYSDGSGLVVTWENGYDHLDDTRSTIPLVRATLTVKEGAPDGNSYLIFSQTAVDYYDEKTGFSYYADYSLNAEGEAFTWRRDDEAVAISQTGWNGVSLVQPEVINGVYQIGTPEELAWFSKAINNYEISSQSNAVLTADIDLNNKHFTPIGEWRCFLGIFDGQNHKIFNFNMQAALSEGKAPYGIFAHVGESFNSEEEKIIAEVKNLTVQGTVHVGLDESVTEDEYYGAAMVGGVAGRTTNAILTNVTSKVNIYFDETEYKGSFVYIGGISGEASEATFINCTNEGIVQGYAYIGGIVGGTQTCEFINCVNKGNVTGIIPIDAETVESYQRPDSIGGIVGGIEDTSIANCTNSGTVSGYNNIGGIVGFAYDGNITGCENIGGIYGRKNLGGIIGTVQLGFEATDLFVKNCINSGTVSRDCNLETLDPEDGFYGFGGIVGWLYSDEATRIIGIENCGNKGNIANGDSEVGGIVGWLNFSNCTVTTTVIENCYNEGNISGTEDGIGGIAGIAGSVSVYASEVSDILIKNCYNTGSVTGGSFAMGGITGWLDLTELTVKIPVMKNCFNLGAVTTEVDPEEGAGALGAIAGYIVANDAEITYEILEDMYYLNGSCEEAYTFDGSDATFNNEPISMTAAEFAASGFVTTLNQNAEETVFTAGRNHPIFIWDSGEAITPVKGDLDGNGVVEKADAQLLYRYCNGMATLTQEQLLLAEVSGDNKISLRDVMRIYDYCNNLISDFEN